MDRRQTQKQKLERDLARYRALLRLMIDERAVAALNHLIKETTDRLNDLDNNERPARS